jgi:hypothetical protein
MTHATTAQRRTHGAAIALVLLVLVALGIAGTFGTTASATNNALCNVWPREPGELPEAKAYPPGSGTATIANPHGWCPGDPVNIVARPNPGYRFYFWVGPAGDRCHLSTNPTCTSRMTRAPQVRSYLAVFGAA